LFRVDLECVCLDGANCQLLQVGILSYDGTIEREWNILPAKS